MVSEAVPPGTYILTVDAIDEDDTDNGKLYYTLDGNHKGHFAIDAATGRLKTNAKLDRETQASCTKRRKHNALDYRRRSLIRHIR